MIEIVDGVGVGSGKSFYVVTRCLAHFLRGGTVYSSDSFVLYFERIKELARRDHGLELCDSQYRQVPGAEIIRLHETTPGGTDDCPVLIVVDEAQDHFDVRDHADKNKRAFFSWCTQSRHDNNDLIFITQDANNIDARFRRLATYRITVRNSRTWKAPGLGSLASLIQLVSLGCNDGWYFVAHFFDRDGRTLVERKWIKARKALLNLYESKSRQMAHKRAGIVGKVDLKRVERKKGDMKYVILLFVAVGLCSLGFLGYRVSKGALFGTQTEVQRGQTVASKPIAKVAMAEAASTSKYQTRLEVFRGFYQSGDVVILRTDQAEYRKGVMSPSGFCVGIDVEGRVAHVRGPEGEHIYVIASNNQERMASTVLGGTHQVKAEAGVPVAETVGVQGYMGYGESIATGHGNASHLDFAQARVNDGKHQVSRERASWATSRPSKP